MIGIRRVARAFARMSLIVLLGTLLSLSGFFAAIANGVLSTTTLVSSPSTVYGGNTVQLTVTVAGDSGTPEGTVQFYWQCSQQCGVGYTLIGTATLINGTATITTPNLSYGFGNQSTISFRAIYAGSPTYLPSEGSTTQTIQPNPTSVSVVATPSTGVLGQPATFDIQVSSATGDVANHYVYYSIDNANPQYLPLDGSGQATLTLTGLALGAHSVVVTYNQYFPTSGACCFSDNQPSNSQTTYSVTGGSGAAANVAISSSPNPVYSGLPTSLTATVTGASGTPTGTVQFYWQCAQQCGSGYTLIGTAPLVNGSATITTPNLSYNFGNQATYDLRVIYLGDSTYAANEAYGTQSVQPNPTSVSVVATPSAGVLGQPATFDIQVSSPSGDVAYHYVFYNLDNNGPQYLPLDSSGHATLTLNGLSLGAHSVVITYNQYFPSSGGCCFSDNLPSNSQTTYTVTGGTGVAANVSISSSPNPVYGGHPTSLTATVTGASGTPTGSVQFYWQCAQQCGSGYQLIGTAPLVNGSATITTPNLSYGSGSQSTYGLRAIYLGDSTYAANEAFGTQSVQPNATALSVVATPSIGVLAQPATFDIQLSSATGDVSYHYVFYNVDNTGPQYISLDASGHASLTLNGLAIGAHSVVITYNQYYPNGGSCCFAENLPSSGQKLYVVTNGSGAGTSSVSVTSSLNPATQGASVTLTATVSGTPTPTGTVVFSEGSNDIGIASLSGGVGTFTTNALTVGSHSITAQYYGDATYAPAASPALTQQVVGAPASIALNGGNNQSATILTAFATPLSVLVKDASNNPVANATVTFTAPGSGASSVFSNASNVITVTTNASGIATATVTANGTVGGPYAVTAQTGAYSVSFSLTNTVGAPATIAVNGGNNQSALILTPFSTPLSVLVTDGGSNPVSGASVTFTAPNSGASGTFPGNSLTASVSTDGSGIATAPAFTANGTAGGPYSVSAQVGAHATSFALTNTQSATTTTIASSSSNAFIGEQVTFTAQVSPAAAPGTVTFSDGVTPICSAAALSSGTATCQASFSTAGSHSVSAHYNGSSTYAPSTSPSITITVTDQRVKTVEVIGKFLSLRNDMLLTHEPSGQRQIDRLMRLEGGEDGTGFAQAPAVSAMRTSAAFAAGGNADLASAPSTGFSSAATTRSGFLEQAMERTGLSAWRDETAQTGFYPQFGSLTGSSDQRGTNLSFATSFSELMRYGAQRDTGALGVNGAGEKLPGASSGVDVWLQGEYASFDDDRGSDASGHFGVVYLGADYVPRPWLLVGAMIQYDDAKQTSSAASYEIEGTGWMAGPYATVRLSRSLFWQSRAAWGTSSNSVSPFLTYTDNFDSTRWLLSSSLTGNWASGHWRFRPSASFAYIEDESDAYLDHFGVLIPSVTTSLGQLKAEPEVVYVYQTASGTRLEPRLTGSLIWNFDSSDAGAAFGGSLIGPEELRGKLEAGIGVHLLSGITLDVSGSYDGIGSDDYNATSISLGARVPMN